MKATVIVVIAMVTAGVGAARTVDLAAGATIPVCIEPGTSVWMNLSQAEMLASRMFIPAGIRIDWRQLNSCPEDGIKIVFSYQTDENDHPRALAYAMPYEGTTIVLFLDRLKCTARDSLSGLLAHVLVHEITHILEGVAHHSSEGIMKPVFDHRDIRRMSYEPLTFAPEDLELIRHGLELRRMRLAERRLNGGGADSITESAPRDGSRQPRD